MGRGSIERRTHLLGPAKASKNHGAVVGFARRVDRLGPHLALALVKAHELTAGFPGDGAETKLQQNQAAVCYIVAINLTMPDSAGWGQMTWMDRLPHLSA